MTRMFSPDGSCPIDELTYKEAQKVCKMLGLSAVGRRQVLEDRLSEYEDEKGIRLKIFIYTIINRSSVAPQLTPKAGDKEFAIKVLEQKV